MQTNAENKVIKTAVDCKLLFMYLLLRRIYAFCVTTVSKCNDDYENGIFIFRIYFTPVWQFGL